MQRMTLAAMFVLICLFGPATVPVAQAALIVSEFGPAAWGSPDVALGIAGATIEDFEDVALAAGLQVQLSATTGNYGPTSTLPATFDPAVDDSTGTVFVAGVWDGSKVLLNSVGNDETSGAGCGYNCASFWGDLSFVFASGITLFGVSLEQSDSLPIILVDGVVNGLAASNLQIRPPYTTIAASSERNGYIRIDLTNGDFLTKVKFDNQAGGADGFAVDHLAFQSAPANVPEPATLLLFGTGLSVLTLSRARRRC